MKYIFILVLFFAGASIGALLGAPHQMSNKDVYALCMDAHNEINGASEQACGDAQDKTNTQFMCNGYITKTAYCWIESK